MSTPKAVPTPTYQPKYTPEKLQQLVAEAEERKSKGTAGEELGGILAALVGGVKGSASYDEGIKARKAEEDKKLTDFQRNMGLEQTMIKSKFEQDKLRQMNDPNSPVSKAAFNSLMMIAEGNPRIKTIIDKMDPSQMTAANITAMFPAVKVAVENNFKQQKLASDAEIAKAKQETANERVAVQRENQIGRMNLATAKAEAAAAKAAAANNPDARPSDKLLGKDQRWVDRDGRWVAEIIPGTKTDQQARSKFTDARDDVVKVQNTANDINRLITKILAPENKSGFEGNFGGYNALATKHLPGNTQDVGIAIQRVKELFETAGLTALKSGAGGIGAITEKEWPKMAASIAKLDPKMSEEEARRIFEEVKQQMLRMDKDAREKFDTEWGDTRYYRPIESASETPGKIGESKSSSKEVNFGDLK